MNKIVVDFHAHPVTDEFRNSMDYLGINPIDDDGFPLPKWSAEEHVEFMKNAGIDYTVLSVPAPHIHNGDNQKSRNAARSINLSVAEICKAHSDKFGFVACVPLPDTEGAVLETAYAMDELGAIGVKLATNSNGVYLGDKAFEPLMKELNDRKALAILHPCKAKDAPKDVITGTVAAIFEYPTDTTRSVLNMISNQVMTRYPNIRFVVPHCGSFLPYMLQRFKGVSSILSSLGMMNPVDADKEFEKLYFDIAGDPEPVALDMLTMMADRNKIVFGSDYPHSPAPVIIQKKKHFDSNEKYTALRKSIYSDNAQALLNNK